MPQFVGRLRFVDIARKRRFSSAILINPFQIRRPILSGLFTPCQVFRRVIVLWIKEYTKPAASLQAMRVTQDAQDNGMNYAEFK